MSYYSNKDKMDCNDYKDICRNHSAKTEREMFRVCPSKLSKRELEDLYFNLLETNLELKKTVNGQQDKIRVLSTQVQRLTNTQERLVSREMKDRGTATKAVVDEQKDFISELKETNQRLTDRIQHLNMRLCSAKQFMKTSPPQTAPFRGGNRSAATAVSTPKKTPRKTNVIQNNAVVEKTPRKTNLTENNALVDKKSLKSEEQPCDENKCRTLMEELKQKIATLQNELLNVHGEYATRIGRLETEVIEVRKENIRVLSERSASECELTDTYKRANELMAKYRSYEAKCAELTAELAIEKRKVTELETQLKAANMSDKVNKTIEEHLTTKQDSNPKCMKCCFKDEQEQLGQPPTKTNEGQVQGVASPKGDLNSTSTNNDSGYQDISDEQQALIKQNRELMEKVLELQKQVDCLKIGGFCGMPECQSESFSEIERSPKKTADNSVASPAVTTPLVEVVKASEPPEDKSDRANSPEVMNKTPIQPPSVQGEPPSPKAEPVEQTEPSPKLKTFGSIITVASDYQLDQTKRKLHVESLDNPEETDKESIRRLRSAESRTTVIGKQDITHKLPVPDKYGYPDIPNNDLRENDSKHSLKFEVVEKKKREGSIASIMPRRMESKTMSLKSVTIGPGFNPEKLKYLEAEGLKRETPTGSIAESIPSNPELGYGMPRVRNKVEQARSIAESDYSGTSTRSAQKPGEMVIEKMLASGPSAPRQADPTRKVEEGCQYCGACSFDKQCTHKTEPTMNKLALGMQKEHAKKNEQHSQVTRQSQSLDTGKEKKGHFRRQKKENQSAEEFIVDPKVYARKTSQTIGGPLNLPDVPLLENREPSANEYIIYKGSEVDQKTLARQKREKLWKRRKSNRSQEDMLADTKMIAQHACKTAGDAVNLPDVPLLEKAVEEKSNCEPGKDENEGKADTKKSQKAKSRRPSCMKGTQVADNPENMTPRERRRAVSMSDRATYTLDSKPAGTSPDNTDLEMSYLSDLPMEKEKKSPLKSRPLSPGEDKATTSTSTSQGTSPLTDYSLSEGEMPAPATKRRLSEPNRSGVFVNNILAHKEETPPMQQMEAALQAITTELQRCKTLLHRHRPEPLARHPTVS